MAVQGAPTQSQDVGAPAASDQVITEAGSPRDEATEMQIAPSEL